MPVIRANGMKTFQEVLYEREMPRCAHCHFIGHDIDHCRTQRNEKREVIGSDKGQADTPAVKGKDEEAPATEASNSDKPVEIHVEETPNQPPNVEGVKTAMERMQRQMHLKLQLQHLL